MRKLLIWSLIFIALVGLFWYSNGKITQNRTKNNLSSISKNSPIANQDLAAIKNIEKILLTKYGKINFSEIKEKKQSGIEMLSENMAGLIDKKAQNVIIQKIIYSSGKKGFHITYAYPDWSSDAFWEKVNFISKKQKWQILVSQRTDNFAFADFEDAHSQARLVSFQGGGGLTEEVISIIEK